MSTPDKDIIERFCDAIWLQEGLSANTLDAYRRDLEGLSRWLAPRGTALTTASRGDLLDYLSGCVGKGARPRTTARLLSSLRRFYGYLVREERIKTDPTALIDSPKIGRPLPKSLTEEQVEKLLQSPDVATHYGLRDRAMLETLYATGLRVSELVGLTLSQVSLTQGVVRVIGKGDKERLVPMGEEAISWISRYLAEGRPRAGAQPLDRCAVRHRARRAHDAPGLLAQPQGPHAHGRHPDGAVAPHPAPRLRHASAQSRRRFARGANAARPRRSFHHADLHACCAGKVEDSA